MSSNQVFMIFTLRACNKIAWYKVWISLGMRENNTTPFLLHGKDGDKRGTVPKNHEFFFFSKKGSKSEPKIFPLIRILMLPRQGGEKKI